MASSDGEASLDKPRVALSSQRLQDIVWKVVAAMLVAFLIYVLLHFGSQLIELQGG